MYCFHTSARTAESQYFSSDSSLVSSVKVEQLPSGEVEIREGRAVPIEGTALPLTQGECCTGGSVVTVEVLVPYQFEARNPGTNQATPEGSAEGIRTSQWRWP